MYVLFPESRYDIESIFFSVSIVVTFHVVDGWMGGWMDGWMDVQDD